MRPSAPVFEPQLWFDFTEPASQFYAVPRRLTATGVENHNLDALAAHEPDRLVARRVLGIRYDDTRNAKLNKCAGAHEARLESGVHRCVVTVVHPSRIPQRCHLTVDDRVALLHERIVSLAYDATRGIVDEHRTDRTPSARLFAANSKARDMRSS